MLATILVIIAAVAVAAIVFYAAMFVMSVIATKKMMREIDREFGTKKFDDPWERLHHE